VKSRQRGREKREKGGKRGSKVQGSRVRREGCATRMVCGRGRMGDGVMGAAGWGCWMLEKRQGATEPLGTGYGGCSERDVLAG